MELAALSDAVAEYFRGHAATFGLRPESVDARYVVNASGFTNASFTVSDRSVPAYHVKLTQEPHCVARLRRWHALQELLQRQYHAPKIVARVRLLDAEWEGLVFPHIQGQTLDHGADATPDGGAGGSIAPVMQEILGVVGALHADSDLAKRLRDLMPAETPVTFRGSFAGTFLQRYEEDLAAIENERPPFVSPKTLTWMRHEAAAIARMAHESSAFGGIASAPIHGDLHLGNLLLKSQPQEFGAAWFILDWDDLALGDPALDYATLLGPLLNHGPAETRRDAIWYRAASPWSVGENSDPTRETYGSSLPPMPPSMSG